MNILHLELDNTLTDYHYENMVMMYKEPSLQFFNKNIKNVYFLNVDLI